MAWTGITLCPCIVVSPQLESWIARSDALYQSHDAARRQGDPAQLDRLVPRGQRFALTASSFTLGTVLSDDDLRAFAASICRGQAALCLDSQLGSALAWDVDQSWLRRQYAPARYPRWHAPHGWHQDAALGVDFTRESASDSPAFYPCPMVTCWIALDSCGVQSPGLEFVTRPLDDLIQPAELTEERVRSRFPPEEFWRPVMQAGDALLFRGEILHRTHVTPGMTRDRTSIEARFFPADQIPERLKSDRFLYGSLASLEGSS
jgi:hypothetical protein